MQAVQSLANKQGIALDTHGFSLDQNYSNATYLGRRFAHILLFLISSNN